MVACHNSPCGKSTQKQTLMAAKTVRIRMSLECGSREPAGSKCCPAKNIGAPHCLQMVVPRLAKGISRMLLANPMAKNSNSSPAKMLKR